MEENKEAVGKEGKIVAEAGRIAGRKYEKDDLEGKRTPGREERTKAVRDGEKDSSEGVGERRQGGRGKECKNIQSEAKQVLYGITGVHCVWLSRENIVHRERHRRRTSVNRTLPPCLLSTGAFIPLITSHY